MTPAHPQSHAATWRIPSGRLAIWWFILSEIVIFGGAVCCFLLLRIRHPEWTEEAALTMNAAGATNTVVLLTSSLFAVLAHHEASAGRGKRASRYLWLTIAGGLIFLCVKAVEYTTEFSHGLLPSTNLFWSFYYLMTGLHALHVIGGMIAIGAIARQASREENLHRVELVGLYWHFVDIVWIFLFPLLYLAG